MCEINRLTNRAREREVGSGGVGRDGVSEEERDRHREIWRESGEANRSEWERVRERERERTIVI